MKDFILTLFSPLLQLNVIISTIGGFLFGGFIGGFGASSLYGGNDFNITTACIVAVIAFCNSSIISGFGLTLDEIRRLLELQNPSPHSAQNTSSNKQGSIMRNSTKDNRRCKECDSILLKNNKICNICGHHN